MDIPKFKLLIAATGSVATIKLPLLIHSILALNVPAQRYIIEIVAVIVTEHAKKFYSRSDLESVVVYDDKSEWDSWNKRGDPVLHIELGKMADMMVIAPLDANTLAKIVQGICDNLLTCTARAWDISKPLLFCPAMNTRMWEHPVTAKQVATLKEWGHEEIPPIEKTLMCGDTGVGAMAEVDSIVKRIKSIAQHKIFGRIS